MAIADGSNPVEVHPTERSAPHTTGLAKALDIERACVPDREAMLAALRVVLGLPRDIPRQDGT
jgi:hypothetical protein